MNPALTNFSAIKSKLPQSLKPLKPWAYMMVGAWVLSLKKMSRVMGFWLAPGMVRFLIFCMGGGLGGMEVTGFGGEGEIVLFL